MEHSSPATSQSGIINNEKADGSIPHNTKERRKMMAREHV